MMDEGLFAYMCYDNTPGPLSWGDSGTESWITFFEGIVDWLTSMLSEDAMGASNLREFA